MELPTRQDLLTPEDIETLVNDKVPESRTLDYKRDWYKFDKQKLAFLRDFSSFANTTGGHIVCGIEEKEVENSRKKLSVPDNVFGVKWDSDAEKKEVNQCLNEWLLPRLHGYWIKSMLVKDKEVVVIYVPRSHLGPHSVRVERSNPFEFYFRSDADNVKMDYDQIRRAFLDSHGKSNEVRRFREERLMALRSGSLGIKPPSTGILLHAIPVGFPDNELSIESFDFYKNQQNRLAQTFSSRFHNFDGFIEFGPVPTRRDQEYNCHAQLFRNGAVEISIGELTSPQANSSEEFLIVYATKQIQERLSVLRAYYELRDFTAQILVGVSLFGMVEKKMVSGDIHNPYSGYKIPQDSIIIPEVELSMDDLNVQGLKPVLDILWQAGGWERCQMFDEAGNWKGKG